MCQLQKSPSVRLSKIRNTWSLLSNEALAPWHSSLCVTAHLATTRAVLRRGHRHRSSRSWTQSHWRGPHRDASPRAVVCSRLLCVSAMLAGGSRWGRKATCVRRLAKMPSGACLKASNGRNALREIERKERARVTCSIGRELDYGRYRCRQRELSSPAWGPLPSLRAMP